MKKRRVLVLMHHNLVPPDSLEGMTDAEIRPIKMEFDVVEALRELGHEVRTLGVDDELLPIRHAIEEFKPHVAFNALTHFHNVATYDAHVVSYLELLKTPYTGTNPRGMLLAGDKALSKKILTYHRIPVPTFHVVRMGRRAVLPKRMEFPVIVKSVAEHASLGIAQASIVKDAESLAERVDYLHRKLFTDAILERYIEGSEITIGVLGNERITTFPIWELVFDSLPDGAANIATSKAKWDLDYQAKIGLRTGPAENLSDEQRAKIARLAKRIFRVLGMSGYARIDLRMDHEGNPFVLEANPNPDLTYGEDFAESAKLAGVTYRELIQKVVSLGIGYGAEWKIE